MKRYSKQVLTAVLMLIVAGVVIAGIGYVIIRNNEGSLSMENQSYAIAEITAIQIETDSPNVVITPVDGDEINLSWQTDDYVEYEATLTDGKLSIRYRIGTNWLKSILNSWLSSNEYILEIELPNGYKGPIEVSAVSGKIIADTSADLSSCSLTSVSGSISAANINSNADIEIRNTSGSTSVDSVHAAGDITIKTVSGSIAFMKSGAQGGVELKTASGGVTAAELTTAGSFYLKTTSGGTEISQLTCTGEAALESVSGLLQVGDVTCTEFSAKTVSGSIRLRGLTAETIKLKSTSGSIKGSITGSAGEYSVSVSTVSGKSNVQNTKDGEKKLTLNTVSGGIDIQFESGN